MIVDAELQQVGVNDDGDALADDDRTLSVAEAAALLPASAVQFRRPERGRGARLLAPPEADLTA